MISLFKNNVHKGQLRCFTDRTLCTYAAVQESRVQVKIQALGVVELRPLLVLPPTVNAIVEVAIIDPVLQDRQETRQRSSSFAGGTS